MGFCSAKCLNRAFWFRKGSNTHSQSWPSIRVMEKDKGGGKQKAEKKKGKEGAGRGGSKRGWERGRGKNIEGKDWERKSKAVFFLKLSNGHLEILNDILGSEGHTDFCKGRRKRKASWRRCRTTPREGRWILRKTHPGGNTCAETKFTSRDGQYRAWRWQSKQLFLGLL